jgi:hypothetical protein
MAAAVLAALGFLLLCAIFVLVVWANSVVQANKIAHKNVFFIY